MATLQEVFSEIRKRINSSAFDCIKQTGTFIQIKKNGASNLWADTKCHYEFLYIKKDNVIRTDFHAENGVPDAIKKSLHGELSKLSGIKKTRDSWWCKTDKSEWIRIDGDDATAIAERLVSQMEEFIKTYGDAIDRAIESAEKGDAAMNDATANTKLLDACVELLKNNHNIILHGAPGTGKTWIAQRIAERMIFGKSCIEDNGLKDKLKNENSDEHKDFEQQFGFVQFHQSYDYTDFVEGLRPIRSGDGSDVNGFDRVDGVFKSFCAKALANLKEVERYGVTDEKERENAKTFDILYNRLLQKIMSDEETTYTTVKSGELPVWVDEKGKMHFGTAGGERAICVIKEYVEKLYAHFKEKDAKTLEGLGQKEMFDATRQVVAPISKRGTSTVDYIQYRWVLARLKEIETNDEKEVGEEQSSLKSERKTYVFVIDEINRGELSKIFGELFFSIDPGYRGKKGRISTQYQNLVDEGDAFESGFFVPENVYIIGTMNDIDRSVESMDFAMRRRFAFKEIPAAVVKDGKYEVAMFDGDKKWEKSEGETVDVSNCLDEIKRRMQALNNAICPEDAKKSERKRTDLTRAYHIGGAYFLKFANYFNGNNKEDAFKALWDNHLEGLLREYLRGRDDACESKLIELKNAYFDEPKVAEQEFPAGDDG